MVAFGISAESPEAIAQKGIALLEAGKPAEAEELFVQALRANPKLIEAQNLLGVALDQQGKHREARASFSKAISLRSDYAPAHANLGLSADQSGEYAMAAAELRTSLKLDPQAPNADDLRYNLALALYRTGGYEQSLDALSKMKPAVRDASYFALAGSDHRELSHNAEALQNLEKAVNLDPGNADFLYDLSIALIQSGSATDAIGRLSSAVQACSRCATLYAALGVAYFAAGKSDEAQKNYEQAIRLQPDAADLRSALGDLYFAAGAYDRSTTEYQQALKLGPKNVNYLVKLGRNSLRM